MVKYHDDEADEYELHPYLVEVMIDYNCHGVMDSRSGKMVIPAIYSDITMISKDLLMAEVDGDTLAVTQWVCPQFRKLSLQIMQV